MRSFVCFLLAVAATFACAVALADEDTRARDEARAGVEAAERGSWSEALAAFRRSYALAPEPAMLLNIASAEAQTGDLLSAAEDYRKVLRAQEPELAAEQRAAVERALERVERRLAHLRIVVRALRRGDRVELDGSPLAESAIDMELSVNPGLHVARVVRGETEVAHRVRTLADGESVAIVLEPTEPRPIPPAPSTSVFRSPWLWLGVGVVVAAGTAGVLCATTLCRDPEPKAGTLGVVKLP
jgi:tetratricopeptide (TPR) repeat protein